MSVSSHDVASMTFEQRLALAKTNAASPTQANFAPAVAPVRVAARNETNIAELTFDERLAMMQARSLPLEYDATEEQVKSQILLSAPAAADPHLEEQQRDSQPNGGALIAGVTATELQQKQQGNTYSHTNRDRQRQAGQATAAAALTVDTSKQHVEVLY